MKYCPYCETEHSLLEFTLRSDRPGQYSSWCKKAYTLEAESKRRKAGIPVFNGIKSPEERKQRKKLWNKKHREKPASRAYQAGYQRNRQALKLQRTPDWLTEHQKDATQAHYDLAAYLNTIMDQKIEVDHIVPLQGKLVSGLHVPWNLQLMTKEANSSKGNRFDYGY